MRKLRKKLVQKIQDCKKKIKIDIDSKKFNFSQNIFEIRKVSLIFQNFEKKNYKN